MSPQIIDPVNDKFLEENLELCSTTNLGVNFKKIEIKYRGHPLIVKFPKLYIPYGLSKWKNNNSEKTYINLTLYKKDLETPFVFWLQKLEASLKKYKVKPTISTSKTQTHMRLRLFPEQKQILVFNQDGEQV